MYPVPIPAYKWKTPSHCQIVCRPDVLVELTSRILDTPNCAGSVVIGSVEMQEKEVLSFLVNVHTTEKVSKLLLTEILDEIRGL